MKCKHSFYITGISGTTFLKSSKKSGKIETYTYARSLYEVYACRKCGKRKIIDLLKNKALQ